MNSKRIIIAFFIALVVVLSVLLFSGKVSSACFGFVKDGVCYNIGSELRINGTYYYVDDYGELREQKQDGEVCQNSFECLNNLCSNGLCVNEYAEVQRNRDLAKNISEQEISVDNYNVRIIISTTKTKYSVGEKIELN